MHLSSRRIALGAALCAVVGLIALPASGSATTPLLLLGYSASVAPSPQSSPANTISGGILSTAPATMTATITNEGQLDHIASVALLPPAPITVQSATLPAGMTQPVVTTCREGKANVACVELSKLNLAYGHSVTVTLKVSTLPACGNASVTWVTVALPSGLLGFLTQLLGLPALPLDSAHSSLATAVDDTCHLQFATQPQDTQQGQPITGATGPVSVDVLDVNNELVTSSTAPVSLAIGTNPPVTGALTPAIPAANASGGVASFSSAFSITPSGVGYTLVASSPGVIAATSSPFDIEAVGVGCTSSSTSNSCSISDQGTAGSANVAATPNAGAPPASLLESVNPPGGTALSCSGVGDPSYVDYNPDTYQVFMTSDQYSKIVTLVITNPINAPAFDPNPDPDDPDGDGDYGDLASSVQICFRAPYTFSVQPGSNLVANGDGTYTGLLADCGAENTSGGPCNERSMDGPTVIDSEAGTYSITAVASIPALLAGDPFMN